jgi:DNA-binding XRE family transcriptional regulator
MKTNKPQTISLDQFKKKFTKDQQQQINEEIAYYDVLMQFKNIRKKAGLTQEELAAKAAINRTTLSKIESGVRNATIGTLMKLSKAMNVTMEINFR